MPPARPVQNDPPKPKPDDKLKLDEVAKLITATKPKSGDETADPQPRLNLTEVSQLLSKETPQQKASTGRELSRVASLGSPTASAAKMSPSLWGQLDGLMQEQYKQCWSYLGLNNADQYIPEIKVEFTPDGALASAADAAQSAERSRPAQSRRQRVARGPALQSVENTAAIRALLRPVEEPHPALRSRRDGGMNGFLRASLPRYRPADG